MAGVPSFFSYQGDILSYTKTNDLLNEAQNMILNNYFNGKTIHKGGGVSLPLS